MTATAQIREIAFIGISLAFERDVTVSSVEVYSPTGNHKLFYYVYHPFHQIKHKEWNVEPFQLLMAMYQLMVQHIPVNPTPVACEHEAEKGYCGNSPVWDEFCLYHLCFYFKSLHSF